AGGGQEGDAVLVAVLRKRDEKSRLVTCRQNFTGTDAYLENRRAARDGGGDRHVGYDVVFAASSQSCQKGAGGLNSVLRISSETNYSVLNVFRPQILTVRTCNGASRRTGPRSSTPSPHLSPFLPRILKLQ